MKVSFAIITAIVASLSVSAAPTRTAVKREPHLTGFISKPDATTVHTYNEFDLLEFSFTKSEGYTKWISVELVPFNSTEAAAEPVPTLKVSFDFRFSQEGRSKT